MHIALVNSIRFYGGGEKRVLRGAYEFRKRGHEVTVLGMPDGALGTRCREEGVPFRAVRMGRYYSPSVLSRMARALRALAPDVAVCYDERSLRVVALSASLARPAGRLPVVFYLGLEGCFKDKAYNRVLVGPRIAQVVANAEALRRELLGFGWFPETRVQVIPDGVDPEPIESASGDGIREELGAVPDDVVALVTARLVPEKGHLFLLSALKEMRPALSRLKVWIAGEGPARPEVEARVEALGLQACVRMLGFRADVPRLLHAADLLCHPSKREGIPNAVREAMVAGLPVAAVAASGTPEVVQDEETGLLSPVDDRDALRANLERLILDPDLRRQLGAAGRRRALAEFSEDLCTERWVALLDGCVKRASGGH